MVFFHVEQIQFLMHHSLFHKVFKNIFFTRFPKFRSSWWISQYSSVQFSCSVVSDSLWAHGLQYTRPPCPLPTPGVYPYSCPLRQWCHRTMLSSVIPFSSCPQSFPGSESFPVSWLFASSGLSIYWNFSFSISSSNEHPGPISFRMDWLDLLAVQGTLKSLLQHHSSKTSILQRSAFFIIQLSYPYMTTGKTIALISVVSTF